METAARIRLEGRVWKPSSCSFRSHFGIAKVWLSDLVAHVLQRLSLTSHALFQRLRRSDRFSDLAAHTLQRLLRSTIPSTVRFQQPLHTRASGRVAIRVIAAMVRRGVRIAIIAAMGIPPTATHGGAAAYATQMMELDWVRRHEWWRWTLRLCMGPTIAVFKCY